jgi:hypothetical protein
MAGAGTTLWMNSFAVSPKQFRPDMARSFPEINGLLTN